MRTLKISVCLASYNGEKYIKEQLDSILCQLSPNDEVIISDDQSTDRTLEIIQSLNDKRIKIFQNKLGNGPVKNFENAITYASGDIIFLSDQDDIWNKEKVLIVLKYFEKGYNLVIHDGEVFENDSKTVTGNFFTIYNSRKGFLKNLFSNSYIGCCMAIDKQLKQKILPFPPNLPMHDSWIGLIAEKFFNVIFIDDKLIKYRYHLNNASYTATGKSRYSLLKKISFRILLITEYWKKVK